NPSRVVHGGPVIAEPAITVAARSVVLLVEQPRESRGRIAAGKLLLDRLARAASIAPEWWDVDGRRTLVGDDTRRALLASMRLPASSEGEARDTLRHLSETRDRRALPHALVSRTGEPAVLSLGIQPGLVPRPVWLTIEQENGKTG